MTKRTEPTLWVVWGLRRGWHPLERGAWHPLFTYRTEKGARIAAAGAPGTPLLPPCKHKPWRKVVDHTTSCPKCKEGPGVWPYERFKACPPGRPPVNPAKVRPTRRRRACGRCGLTWLPKVWRERRRCNVCGWVPPPYRQARVAA